VTALVVSHHIAAPLEVIPAELGLRAQNLATAIKVLDVVDAATYEAGNRLLMDAHQAGKDLEAARVKLKKPITDLGREIERVVASVADPLDAAKRSMLGKVSTFKRKLEEEAERARREAEEKARLEHEAAEKERARLQAEADAKAKQEAEEMAAVLGKAVEPEPVKVELPPAPKPAAIAPAPAPLPKSAAAVRKVQVVEYTDRALVPVAIGGRVLRPIDEAAVKQALLAGVEVPGAKMATVEQLSMSRA
jgi:hypothetical protein